MVAMAALAVDMVMLSIVEASYSSEAADGQQAHKCGLSDANSLQVLVTGFHNKHG